MKDKYQTSTEPIFAAVKSVIDEWNPYSLLPDAPADEFDRESRSIARRISPSSTVNEIAAIVSRVFAADFESSRFQKEDCLEVAARIKAVLAASASSPHLISSSENARVEELGMSRSRFFALAAEAYLRELAQPSITNQTNEALDLETTTSRTETRQIVSTGIMASQARLGDESW